jgi:hypothetical protein
LQQTKVEIHGIRNTLAQLPRTLYETYERVLLSISDEDRVFAQHALEWMLVHNGTQGHSTSCSELLYAVRRSMSASDPFMQDFRYNENGFRKVFGGLITVTLDPCPEISFAHLTVREFLLFGRTSNIWASWFSMKNKQVQP